jgi:ubiquinone/menaquinone biosynthesis C-methylase UbiE
MDANEIQKKKEAIEAEHGPWTAYNINLGHGIQTAPQFASAHLRLRRVAQTITDLTKKPWKELRILDLASLEGIFALEFASHGSHVVAIEGREANNARARFAAETLRLENIEFITDDVRNLSLEKYGQFDVVLCSGILYHLPGEEGCQFVRSIADVCTRLTIIDTHVGSKSDCSVSWAGHTYHGTVFSEHSTKDNSAAKAARTWSSLDNCTSFWITKPSLLNLLRDVGFTSVAEIVRPKSFTDYADRLTFAAIKGEPQHVVMSPELEHTPEPDWPEGSSLPPYPTQATMSYPLWRRVGGILRRRIGI